MLGKNNDADDGTDNIIQIKSIFPLLELPRRINTTSSIILLLSNKMVIPPGPYKKTLDYLFI